MKIESNTPADSTTKPPSKKRKPKKPQTALIRAAIFPGWGQLYTDKYFKAILVFGAQATLAGYSIYYNNKVSTATTDAEKEIWVNRRNTNYGRHVIVILISMLDAYIDAHLYDFDTDSDLAPDQSQKNAALSRQIIQLGYRHEF